MFYGVKRLRGNLVVDLCIWSMFCVMLYTCFCCLFYFVLGFLMSIDILSATLTNLTFSTLYIAWLGVTF
ncbi:hypothetical protein QBC37DRAFT_430275 [Rhypophila decipiens]|uniref:Uncharacterized protein n=1 Tax=Rhypophila decipiens TaxID=261697 RepID=A0AAN7B650_9PEZI|nr:hypothetical protein QBC37DRAFT_430275 [Rhypophila decipiens]